MLKKAIDTRTYQARYRSHPAYGDTVLGTLPQGHPVEVLKDMGQWRACRAWGVPNIVYIAGQALRNRVSEQRENLIRTCVSEWLRFDREKGKANAEPYDRYIGQYWNSIGYDYDGQDQMKSWSAAFISYCVQSTGAYDGFVYSSQNSQFVHAAIHQRRRSVDTGFWGYRVSEHKPQIGDIICRKRSGVKIDFDLASRCADYPSHCDIVISLRDHHVSAIGGNVNRTVKRTNYATDSEGYLTDHRGAYAILRNNQ